MVLRSRAGEPHVRSVIRSRGSFWLVSALACYFSITTLQSSAVAQAPMNPAARDLVFMLDDDNSPYDGCDKVSVFDLNRHQMLRRGSQEDSVVSTGRMTVDPKALHVLSINSMRRYSQPYRIRHFHRVSETSTHWTTDVITGATFTERGDIASTGATFTERGDISFLPDGDTFLVSEGENKFENTLRPAFVSKYRLSHVHEGSIGPSLGTVQLDRPAARILLSPDGRSFHVLEASPSEVVPRVFRIRSFETETLREIASPVLLGGLPITPKGVNIGRVHASLSPDGRFLVTNVWKDYVIGDAYGAAFVNIVDLTSRTSRQVSIGDKQPYTIGGVAFNHAQMQRGLLALHAYDQVLVLKLDEAGSLTEVGRTKIDPLYMPVNHDPQSGPWMSLAWSADGTHVIAAGNQRLKNSPSDFIVVKVDNDGRRLRVVEGINACLDTREELSVPQDVITTNFWSHFPEVVASPVPAASPGDCICRGVRSRVPAAVINAAVADPESIDGWMQLLNPGVPPGPDNPPRTCLALRNRGLDFHLLFNPLHWRVGCD